MIRQIAATPAGGQSRLRHLLALAALAGPLVLAAGGTAPALAALAGPLVLAAGGTAPALAAARAATVSLAAPTTVVYGRSEGVSAQVRDAATGRPRVGVVVVFEGSAGTATVFTRLAQARTDRNGIARYRDTPRSSVLLRARALAGTTTAGGVSATHRTTVHVRLDATARPAVVEPGATCTVRGRVLPARPGTSVRLTRGTGSGATVVVAAVTGSDGRFTMSLRPPDDRRLPYHLVTDATATLGPGGLALDVRVRRPVATVGRQTGRTTLSHPTWGPLTVITSVTDQVPGRAFVAHLVVADAAGDVRLRRDWAWGAGTLELNRPAQDSTGNVFLRYNPGRYDGVIVLRGVPHALASFGTLPPADGYQGTGPFGYDAVTTDVRPRDGRLEIVQSENDCIPDCATEGSHAERRYQWNGSAYVREPVPVSCEGSGALLRACRFVLAVQQGNPSSLSSAERRVAARAHGLPARDFRGIGCTLVGDITARCEVRFRPRPQDSARRTPSAFLEVQPVNCTYHDGTCTYPPGKGPRYGVVRFDGLTG